MTATIKLRHYSFSKGKTEIFGESRAGILFNPASPESDALPAPNVPAPAGTLNAPSRCVLRQSANAIGTGSILGARFGCRPKIRRIEVVLPGDSDQVTA